MLGMHHISIASATDSLVLSVKCPDSFFSYSLTATFLIVM